MRFSLGEVVIAGSLALESIREVLQLNGQRIRACYDDQAQQRPPGGGSVQVALKIGPLGTVISASVTGIHISVEVCLTDLFKSIVFPKPTNGAPVEVTMPLTFGP